MDELPRTKFRPPAIIVNSDPSSQPGTHWLAIFLHCDGRGTFFDSYGQYPPSSILMFLRKQTKGRLFNRRLLWGVHDQSREKNDFVTKYLINVSYCERSCLSSLIEMKHVLSYNNTLSTVSMHIRQKCPLLR